MDLICSLLQEGDCVGVDSIGFLEFVQVVLFVLHELLLEGRLKEQVVVVVLRKFSVTWVLLGLPCKLAVLVPLQIENPCVFLTILVLELRVLFAACWKIDILGSDFSRYLCAVLDISEELVVVVIFGAVIVVGWDYFGLFHLFILVLILHVKFNGLTVDLVVFDGVGVLGVILNFLIGVELYLDRVLNFAFVFGNSLSNILPSPSFLLLRTT